MMSHKTAQRDRSSFGDYFSVHPADTFFLLLNAYYHKFLVFVFPAAYTFFLSAENSLINLCLAVYGMAARAFHSFHYLAFEHPTSLLSQRKLPAKFRRCNPLFVGANKIDDVKSLQKVELDLVEERVCRWGLSITTTGTLARVWRHSLAKVLAATFSTLTALPPL